MVNYTLGEGFGKQAEFRVKSSTGEICISSELDYETRNVYEFPIVATDRGKFLDLLYPTWVDIVELQLLKMVADQQNN